MPRSPFKPHYPNMVLMGLLLVSAAVAAPTTLPLGVFCQGVYLHRTDQVMRIACHS